MFIPVEIVLNIVDKVTYLSNVHLNRYNLKNIRLISNDFANSYGPYFIANRTNSDFLKEEYHRIILINNKMFFSNLRHAVDYLYILRKKCLPDIFEEYFRKQLNRIRGHAVKFLTKRLEIQIEERWISYTGRSTLRAFYNEIFGKKYDIELCSDRYQNVPFPTQKQEDYIITSVSFVQTHPWHQVKMEQSTRRISRDQINKPNEFNNLKFQCLLQNKRNKDKNKSICNKKYGKNKKDFYNEPRKGR